MHILGLCFAGTSTAARDRMTPFVADVLGLPKQEVEGVEVDLFELPDGSSFAVSWPGGMGETTRSLGFLVADLEAASAELTAAGIAVGEPGENERERYLHFTAPDGQLYELVERRPSRP
ncbi:VOC family protein [Nocardioides sp. BP30]|uniref:VOC family protein n=1 Tax=Nocardioides sp. BP30 TaxID=3036374 RepID=UPI002468D3E4|nr:VOC family protein [Nocardioides sp. BP30]WGL50971.1 VOC family protein [Nocardioides sp. BP30]